MTSDGNTWVVGDLLATQGQEGCRDVRCSRIGGRCVGWHCPHCGEPTSSQGHRCPQRPGVEDDRG